MSIDYHQAHEPYIEVVAAAVVAAGVEPADWGAEPNDPRDGYLHPAPPVGPDDGDGGLVVGWSEERGWFYGEVKDAGRELAYVSYFGGGVLPAPETVAALIALLATGDEGLPNEAPATRRWQYRSFDDEDDGFEAELAAFHARGSLTKTTTSVDLPGARGDLH